MNVTRVWQREPRANRVKLFLLYTSLPVDLTMSSSRMYTWVRHAQAVGRSICTLPNRVPADVVLGYPENPRTQEVSCTLLQASACQCVSSAARERQKAWRSWCIWTPNRIHSMTLNLVLTNRVTDFEFAAQQLAVNWSCPGAYIHPYENSTASSANAKCQTLSLLVDTTATILVTNRSLSLCL